MIRISKILGIACVAMACMAAPAAAAEFHSEAASTTISGSQTTTNTITTHSGTIHCTTTTFSGSMSAKTTSNIVVAPTYSGCKSTGFIEANVTLDTNGCDYNLTASGSVHLQTCNAGAAGIVITAPFCTITIASGQTFPGSSHTHTGSGIHTHETWHAIFENIAYSESGFACKNSGSNTTGGSYAGSVKLSGSSGGSPVGIWWE